MTFSIPGRPPIALGDHPSASYLVVDGGYFQTMKIPSLRGRLFDQRDTAQSGLVVIMNDAFARKHFPAGNALGQTVAIDRGAGKKSVCTVVGVVGDSRHDALGTPAGPEMYVPLSQDPQRALDLVVRTASENLTGLNAGIRDAVQQIDRDVFVPQLRPMESLVSASLAQPRFNMMLLAIFAGVAMILAAIGIYGVIAYSVTQRTREIGIRMALGAQRRQMLRMVLRESLTLVLAGLGIGFMVALATTRLLRTLLYGVGANDWTTYLSVVLLLGGAALLASYIPARRAMKVDPMVALRYE